MIRRNLLAWQWSDYAAKHQDRVNLLVHLVAVPLFQVGTLILVLGAGIGSALAIGLGVGCLVGGVLIEGRVGWPVDAIVVALIVIVNAVLGYLQEAKAANAVAPETVSG